MKKNFVRGRLKRYLENFSVLLPPKAEAETLGGIIQNPQVDFVQKKFGFRPKDTAILNSGSEVNVHVIIMLSAHGSAG